MAFVRGNQTVNVSKTSLVEHLNANMLKHIREYNEAVEGFKDEMVKVLQEELKKARKGELKKLDVRLAAPVSHENEYRDAIDMLEFSVDENIQLDADTFKAYFKDVWSWSDLFNHTVATYSSKSKI